jgi:hypothetical protein
MLILVVLERLAALKMFDLTAGCHLHHVVWGFAWL